MNTSNNQGEILGEQEDGNDFFQKEIGTFACILSNSLPKVPSPEDRIIVQHHFSYYPQHINHNYFYMQRKQPSWTNANKIKYRQKPTHSQQLTHPSITSPNQFHQNPQQQFPQTNIGKLQTTAQTPVQTVSMEPTTIPSQSKQAETLHPQEQASQEQSLQNQLNTAYIDSQQMEEDTIADNSNLISFLEEKQTLPQLQSQPQPQEQPKPVLQSVCIDLNPKSKKVKTKKQFLGASKESPFQPSLLLGCINQSYSRSFNRSHNDSINLNKIIHRHISQYTTIAQLEQASKREILVELQTNSFVKAVAVKAIRILPLDLLLKLSSCECSIVSPSQVHYSLPSNHYREQKKIITLCALKIPNPPPGIPHPEYYQLVASHMMRVETCYLACVCGAKTTVQIKENLSGGLESCGRCSNLIKVTLNSMRANDVSPF